VLLKSNRRFFIKFLKEKENGGPLLGPIEGTKLERGKAVVFDEYFG